MYLILSSNHCNAVVQATAAGAYTVHIRHILMLCLYYLLCVIFFELGIYKSLI